MRELDPKSPPTSVCAVVGAGRLGTVLAAALSEPAAARPRRGRSARGRGRPAVRAGRRDRGGGRGGRRAGPLVGHCSGATGLEALGDREGFSLHPLMSVPTGSDAERAARRGRGGGRHQRRARSRRARAGGARSGCARRAVEPEDRVAYHAAGAMAANFLVALEACAERLAATAGVTRAQLAPLVLATARPVGRAGRRRRRSPGRSCAATRARSRATAATVAERDAGAARAVGRAGRRDTRPRG